MSDAHPFPQVDPDRNQILLVVGRKGSGKSVFAHELFRGWPAIDKLVIDVHADADPGEDLHPITYRGQVPDHLPPPAQRGGHVVVRWIADPAAKTYREDVDRAAGLALFPKHRRTLLWVDEAGEVFPHDRTGPNARLLLQQSRHYYASVIMCCPRPITINTLCLTQADYVVMYDVPGVHDRRRLAETLGLPHQVLVDELNATRRMGEHWFLMYVAREHTLYRCPPLPLSDTYAHAQQ